MTGFRGHLSLLAAVRDHGRTVLAAQSFRAPFHISKPYWDPDVRALLVQVVNPTAGILAGDRLESDIAVHRDAALIVTTPSASRVFRMRSGEAECRQHFVVSRGAWLEVSPEPLVPHRGSRYRQVTTIEIELGGSLFFVDSLLPGRIGHGEAWQWERLNLDLSVQLDGELLLRERFDHRPGDLRLLAEFAGSGPTACFANAVLIADGPSTADWLPAVHALHADGLWVGASALRRGGWTLKLIARNPLRLREGLAALRRTLAAYFPRLACEPRKL